jgi:hypothetical protein
MTEVARALGKLVAVMVGGLLDPQPSIIPQTWDQKYEAWVDTELGGHRHAS